MFASVWCADLSATADRTRLFQILRPCQHTGSSLVHMWQQLHPLTRVVCWLHTPAHQPTVYSCILTSDTVLVNASIFFFLVQSHAILQCNCFHPLCSQESIVIRKPVSLVAHWPFILRPPTSGPPSHTLFGRFISHTGHSSQPQSVTHNHCWSHLHLHLPVTLSVKPWLHFLSYIFVHVANQAHWLNNQQMFNGSVFRFKSFFYYHLFKCMW